MQNIKELLRSWQIISPAEFFFGIGICIGIPLLLISVAFRVFFHSPGRSPGRGWKYDLVGLLACILSTSGLLAVFVVPLFFAPMQVPDWCLATMALGSLIALLAMVILIAAVIFDLRALLRPCGEGEIPWVRGFIFYVPLCLVFAHLLHLYKFFGVK